MKPGTILLSWCVLASPVYADDLPSDDAIRAAVIKAIPLLVKGTTGYAERARMLLMPSSGRSGPRVTIAKGRGIDIPHGTIEGSVELTEADLRGSLESYKKGDGQGEA